MAVSTLNAIGDWTSWVNLQNVGKTLHDLMVAQGWSNTTDPSQVNWAGSAPAAGTIYEILKCNDSKAGTCPIYVKFEYRYGTATPQAYVTIGMGSDGAGNITGNKTSRIAIFNYGAGPSTGNPCYFSAGASYFTVNVFASDNSGYVIGVDRSVDATGAYTDEYVYAVWCSANNNRGSQCLPKTGLATPVETKPCVALSSISTSVYGGSTVYSPGFPLLGKLGQGSLLCGAVADALTYLTSQTAVMYGVAHNYLVIHNSISVNWQNGPYWLLRYE